MLSCATARVQRAMRRTFRFSGETCFLESNHGLPRAVIEPVSSAFAFCPAVVVELCACRVRAHLSRSRQPWCCPLLLSVLKPRSNYGITLCFRTSSPAHVHQNCPLAATLCSRPCVGASTQLAPPTLITSTCTSVYIAQHLDFGTCIMSANVQNPTSATTPRPDKHHLANDHPVLHQAGGGDPRTTISLPRAPRKRDGTIVLESTPPPPAKRSRSGNNSRLGWSIDEEDRLYADWRNSKLSMKDYAVRAATTHQPRRSANAIYVRLQRLQL